MIPIRIKVLNDTLMQTSLEDGTETMVNGLRIFILIWLCHILCWVPSPMGK